MEYIFKDIRNTKQFYTVLSNPLFFNKLKNPNVFKRVFELYQLYDNGQYNYLLIYFFNKIITTQYKCDDFNKIREIIKEIIEPLFIYDDEFCALIKNHVHNYINRKIINLDSIIDYYSYSEKESIINKIIFNYKIIKKPKIYDNEYKLFYDILYKNRSIENIKKYYKDNKFTNKTLFNLTSALHKYINIQETKPIIQELIKTGYYMKYEDLEYMFNNFENMIINNVMFIIKQLLNKHNMKKDVLDIILKEVAKNNLDIFEDFENLGIYPSEQYIIGLFKPSINMSSSKLNEKDNRRETYIGNYIKKIDTFSERFMFSIVEKNDIAVARIFHDNKHFFNEICVNIGLDTLYEEWIEFFITNTYYISEEMINQIVEKKYWSHYDFLMSLKARGYIPYWIDI